MSPFLSKQYVGNVKLSENKVFLNAVFRKCKSESFALVHSVSIIMLAVFHMKGKFWLYDV
jgi:hypothetical protein